MVPFSLSPSLDRKTNLEDREPEFEVSRRSLHKVFMLRGDEAWSKLSVRSLDVYKRCSHSNIFYRIQFDILNRDQILFEVASELELSVISLSGTAEG